MHTTLRKSLKVVGWSLGAVFTLLFIFAGLLLFPGFLFAHKLEQGNLAVYSEEALNDGIEPILREIDRRLATSEINDPSLTHRIFFGHEARIFGAVQGARVQIVQRTIGMAPSSTYNVSWPPLVSHVVTFDVPDAAHDTLRRTTWPGQFNMTNVLTHEVTHSLVFARLGVANTARLPMWKAEGYPEYIAATAVRSEPGYTLRASVARLLDADLTRLRDAQGNFAPLRYDCIGKSYLKNEAGDFWHTCYYLSRVLVEYVLDRKGMSFDQLAQSPVSESETLRELLSAYHDGSL